MDGTDSEIAEEELKDTILGNMSERVITFITEEMEFLAPMRLSEVEEVQLRIVQQCRQLEDQGQIVITRRRQRAVRLGIFSLDHLGI
ncbi:MAG: FliG C-terminal domain-containing protein [Candidatus Latescibacteria bacterium]|nr:FliG C-terminal domain-containing protein [Candidatus Latescibacterota bacterium]